MVLHVIRLATLVGRGRFSVKPILLCQLGSHAPAKATRGGGTLLLARSGSDAYSGAKEIGIAPVKQHGLIVEEDSLWVRKNNTDSHTS